MNTTERLVQAEAVAEARRARLERLSPEDGPAYGLTVAEARRLLAYVGFLLYREVRGGAQRRRGQVRRSPDRRLASDPGREAAGWPA
jgi:hypothetical protein